MLRPHAAKVSHQHLYLPLQHTYTAFQKNPSKQFFVLESTQMFDTSQTSYRSIKSLDCWTDEDQPLALPLCTENFTIKHLAVTAYWYSVSRATARQNPQPLAAWPSPASDPRSSTWSWAQPLILAVISGSSRKELQKNPELNLNWAVFHPYGPFHWGFHTQHALPMH